MNILIAMLVSDGDQNRSKRANLFSPMHGRIGVAIAPHKTRKFVTVIVYCGFFYRKGEESILDKAMQHWMKEPIPPAPLG